MVIFCYLATRKAREIGLCLGPLFWTRSRRRIALVCLVINGNTSGFVLRPRHEVYYKNLASFGHTRGPAVNCTVFNSQPPYRCCAGTTYRNPSSYIISRAPRRFIPPVLNSVNKKIKIYFLSRTMVLETFL